MDLTQGLVAEQQPAYGMLLGSMHSELRLSTPQIFKVVSLCSEILTCGLKYRLVTCRLQNIITQ